MRARTTQEIAAAARAELVQYRKEVRDLVRHLDALIKGAAHLAGLDIDAIRQKRDALQELADRIDVQLGSRSWLYFGLLQEAENVDLRYTLPPKGKPYGSGIDYLRAAAAQHGHQIGSACALIKQFNALPRVRAIFGGEGNMRVDIDVVHSSLWFWMWL